MRTIRVPRERPKPATLAPSIHTGNTVRSPYWSREAGRAFYVSVMDGRRKGILLGPFDTHQEALDNVRRGRQLVQDAYVGAAFYAFGTCSTPRTQPLRPVSHYNPAKLTVGLIIAGCQMCS